MKELFLTHENGHSFKVFVVRYFRFKNNIYLIYTLQEKDERDYMKLYVVKVMKELGSFVSQTVRRTDEWSLMKRIVKYILSEIKKNRMPNIEDLDISELEGLVINENKSFHLASDLVHTLTVIPQEEIYEETKNLKSESMLKESTQFIQTSSVQPNFEENDDELLDFEILDLDDNISEQANESDEVEILDL